MQMLEKFRKWQRENPEWELICDIEDSDVLYIQWNELQKDERMSWIGIYGSSAHDAFEEFAIKQCKVPNMVLDDKLKLRKIADWPYGEAMAVFKTDNKQMHRAQEAVPVI